MKALLSVLSSDEETTKRFELNEDGTLAKGTFSQPREYTLRNILAADTADGCTQQLLDLIGEGFGFCLGYIQHDFYCTGIEYKILPKWKFNHLRDGQNIWGYDDTYGILEGGLSDMPIATRTKLKTRNRTEASNRDFTNMQNARILAFDIDVHDGITYNEVEARAMSSVENYVEWLHELLPEIGFDKAAYLATVSTSGKPRKNGTPELPFNVLSKRGMHIYFILDDATTGVEHKKFEETVKARLLSAGLMRPIPRRHMYSDKINAGIELTEQENSVYGLPNGTLFVTAEILDTAIPNDINRLLFEADPIVPDGYGTHSDRFYRKTGDFVSLKTLPYETVRNKDKAEIKATFRQEILSRKWFKRNGDLYTTDEVLAHLKVTSFSVIDSELNYTLDLSDTLTFDRKNVLDPKRSAKAVWTIGEVYEYLNSQKTTRDRGRNLDLLCVYSEMPERTTRLMTDGRDFKLYVPKMKMYCKLSAHSESILYRDNAVDYFLDKTAIDDTGSDHNIKLGEAIEAGLDRVVSKALHSTGKTHSMLAMAKRPNTFSVVVAPLKSLVSNIIAKFKSEGIRLLNYEDLRNFRGDFTEYDGIAVCAPSVPNVIRAVQANKDKKFCLLVDEVECILKAINSVPEPKAEIIYTEPARTISVLKQLIEHADSFMLADADAGIATRDFIDYCQVDYVVHRNNTPKKIKADGTRALAYINRFTRDGLGKVKKDIVSRINANRDAGKKTIVCSATKKILVELFILLDPNNVALVSTKVNASNSNPDEAKLQQAKVINTLINEGDKFLKNPDEMLANYDVIGLSPKATNGLDITIKDDAGEFLDAELIYIHDTHLNYTHEVCIQHILRLRGANQVHLWLSDYFRPTNHKVDIAAVNNDHLDNAAVAGNEVSNDDVFRFMVANTARYNEMRNEDSRQFTQRLFGYLSRVGFELMTQEYCVDASKSIAGSIQSVWSGDALIVKWEALALGGGSYTVQRRNAAMLSFFIRNVVECEVGRFADFNAWQIKDIDSILAKYSNRKLGGDAISACLTEIRAIKTSIGLRLSKAGKPISIKPNDGLYRYEFNERAMQVPVVDLIIDQKKDDRKNLRAICSAFGYAVGRKDTKSTTDDMSASERVTLENKGKVTLLWLKRLEVPMIPIESVNPIHCFCMATDLDELGVSSCNCQEELEVIDNEIIYQDGLTPYDFLKDWLGYGSSLRGFITAKDRGQSVVR
ncbi:MAG: hypothetical protein MJK15_04205 [Colwellia sp.]|nr:hypothetical protein [Colwellia sp.]